MLEHYTPNFSALSLEETTYLAKAVAKANPGFIAEEVGPYESGEELMHHCEAYGMDQATVVMSLSRDATPIGVQIVERLIGKPIQKIFPKLVKQIRAKTPRTVVKKHDPRIITFVTPNPKRPGSASHTRFELYKVNMTVTQAIDAGLTTGDIVHDSSRGFITLTNPETTK